MNKIIHWGTKLLGLLVLILISWNIADVDISSEKILIHNNKPTYQSEYTTTMIYNITGKLKYKLLANHIDYFAKQQITWFFQPVMISFNENKIPNWIVKADKAKLIKNKTLCLYGNVRVESLINT